MDTFCLQASFSHSNAMITFKSTNIYAL